MKKTLSIVAIVLATVTLTGCGDKLREDTNMERERQYIQLGKECADAGGDWVWTVS